MGLPQVRLSFPIQGRSDGRKKRSDESAPLQLDLDGGIAPEAERSVPAMADSVVIPRNGVAMISQAERKSVPVRLCFRSNR